MSSSVPTFGKRGYSEFEHSLIESWLKCMKVGISRPVWNSWRSESTSGMRPCCSVQVQMIARHVLHFVHCRVHMPFLKAQIAQQNRYELFIEFRRKR